MPVTGPKPRLWQVIFKGARYSLCVLTNFLERKSLSDKFGCMSTSRYWSEEIIILDTN